LTLLKSEIAFPDHILGREKTLFIVSIFLLFQGLLLLSDQRGKKKRFMIIKTIQRMLMKIVVIRRA